MKMNEDEIWALRRPGIEIVGIGEVIDGFEERVRRTDREDGNDIEVGKGESEGVGKVVEDASEEEVRKDAEDLGRSILKLKEAGIITLDVNNAR